VWFLTIPSSRNGTPEFCFSQYSNCHGDGVQLYSLRFARVDERGNPVETVWSVQNSQDRPADYTIKRVAYGDVPAGWTEAHPASSLRDNSYYSVNGVFYFSKISKDQFRVYSREQFFDQIVQRSQAPQQ
jgi:hypothetical protein